MSTRRGRRAIGDVAAGTVALLVVGLVATLVLGTAVGALQEEPEQSYEDSLEPEQSYEDSLEPEQSYEDYLESDPDLDDPDDGSTWTTPDERAELERATPLPPGESAVVGDHTVTVTAIDTDADDVVAAADPGNPEPTYRYVLVDVSVTFASTGTSDLRRALDPVLLGSDGRSYPAGLTCQATVPRSTKGQVPLTPGESASFQVCVDAPPDAIAGSALRLQGAPSSRGPARAFWAVP